MICLLILLTLFLQSRSFHFLGSPAYPIISFLWIVPLLWHLECHHHILGHLGFLPCYFLGVLCFAFKSLFYLSYFYEGVRCVCIEFFFSGTSVFLAPFVEKTRKSLWVIDMFIILVVTYMTKIFKLCTLSEIYVLERIPLARMYMLLY